MDRKLVSFVTVIRFVVACNLTNNKANSHIPIVEIHTRQKL